MLSNTQLAIFAKHIGQGLINAGEELAKLDEKTPLATVEVFTKKADQENKPVELPGQKPAESLKDIISDLPLVNKVNIEPIVQTKSKQPGKINAAKTRKKDIPREQRKPGDWGYWDHERLEELKALSKTKNNRELATHFGTKVHAIANWFYLLKKNAGFIRPEVANAPYTRSEESIAIDEQIKSLSVDYNWTEIAQKLGMKANAVQTRADRLGLTEKVDKDRSAEIDEYIKQWHGVITVEKMAEAVDMSVSGLEKRITKLGLGNPKFKPKKGSKTVESEQKEKAAPAPKKLKEPKPAEEATAMIDHGNEVLPEGMTRVAEGIRVLLRRRDSFSVVWKGAGLPSKEWIAIMKGRYGIVDNASPSGQEEDYQTRFKHSDL